MNLTPKEEERLLTFMAAELARRRKDRGVALNHPEAVAYVSDWCVERARDGESVAEIRAGASQLLGREDVMAGVPEMIDTIQVEPVFPDGTKLVTVHDPIRSDSVGTADCEADRREASDSGSGEERPVSNSEADRREASDSGSGEERPVSNSEAES